MFQNYFSKIIAFIKNYYYYLFPVISLVVVGTLLFLLYFRNNQTTPKNIGAPGPTTNLISSSEPEAKTDINVLLLGYGGEGHDGGSLSDSITLANIKPDTKTVNLISIPRDLYVAIPVDWNNKKSFKINAAYAIGGDERTYPNKKPEFRGTDGRGNLVKYVVGEVAGMDIDYFVSINFTKYKEVIDLVGGLDVNNPYPFEDRFYPVKGLENETCGLTPEEISDYHLKYSGFELESKFTCRYEVLKFDKGMVKMDGETALKYVRSRHSDNYGGDFYRSERQHAVILALKDKIFSLNILNKTNSIFQKLAASVSTDIKIDSIEELIKPLGNIKNYKINHIYITDQNMLINAKSSAGAYILIPKAGEGNYEDIQKFIKDNSK
jgi:polyisoprenyl-teichoic acid--peptidoglycan teichoic acid transferase